MCIENGQVLWMRTRFNNSGDISVGKHPYLVRNCIKITYSFGLII